MFSTSSPLFRWVSLISLLLCTILLKSSLRSLSLSFPSSSSASPSLNPRRLSPNGVFSSPHEYSPIRRWLQEEAAAEDAAEESNSTELYKNCNFTVNYNATGLDLSFILGEGYDSPSSAPDSDGPGNGGPDGGPDGPDGSSGGGEKEESLMARVAEELEKEGLMLVNFTNGTFACEENKEEMPWWEMTLWLLLLLYLFLALYIICDHHFVPALEVVGNGLRWSESVQGATLLAVGSSFPEFVTALVGVIFFPDDNPGPSTNIGSAVFNSCIIIGCSMIFLPKAKEGWRLQLKPFLRDSISFAIAAVATFLVYETWTPKELYWYECLMLSLLYITYVVILITTDKCISPPISDEERQFLEAATAAAVAGQRASMVVFRRFVPPDPKVSFRKSAHWDRTDSRGVISFGSETPRRAAKQRSATWAPNSETGLDGIEAGVVEVELSEMSSTDTTPAQTPRRGLQDAGPSHASHAVASSDIDEKHDGHDHGHGNSKKKSCMGWFYTVLAFPITILLKITTPPPRQMGKCPSGCMTAISCFMSICWLGFVTYFVVEIAQDVFLDLGLGAEFLGLTVLAVGSSLPDCLSSIIVARQGRIDMAVCNALGSNIFDFLFCIGFPFLVQNLMTGEPTFVPVDDSFLYLLISCFVSAGMILTIIPAGCMRATPWHGLFLLLAYAGFITGYILMFGISR